jgi:hypothetical protein
MTFESLYVIGIIIAIIIAYLYIRRKGGSNSKDNANNSQSNKFVAEPGPFSEADLIEFEKQINSAWENMHDPNYTPMAPLSFLGVTPSNILFPSAMVDIVKDPYRAKWFLTDPVRDEMEQMSYFSLSYLAYWYYGAKTPKSINDFLHEKNYVIDAAYCRDFYPVRKWNYKV